MPFKNTIPAEIIALRVNRGLSQGALARLAGVSRGTLIALENGLNSGVRMGTLLRICNALHVTPNHLTGFDTQGRELLGSPTVREMREGCAPCLVCSRVLRRGEPRHRPAECLLNVHMDERLSREALSARFGLTISVVTLMLSEEYGRRSGKRRPIVLSISP